MDKKQLAAMAPAVIAGTILFQGHHPELSERAASDLAVAHLPHPVEEEPEQQIPEPIVTEISSTVFVNVHDTLRVRFG